MCYSLTASINAGIGLGVAGFFLVKRARIFDQKMIVYAYLPVFFSIHQLVEAANWYAIESPFRGDTIFLYLYSIIAFGLWPICIPLAAAIAEPRYQLRKLWWLTVFAGACLSIYLWAKLAFAKGFEVTVLNHSLAYNPLFDDLPQFVFAAYVAITSLPSFLLNNRAVNVFGWIVLGTFFVAAIEARPAWYSVWCMAAALASLSLAFAIEQGDGQPSSRTQP